MSRLLLVEDDSSLGATLKERLAKENYGVLWVQSQGEAEAAIQDGEFDLIVLDVTLPDGSGFDFARKVKGDRKTPFIFITAMNSAEHRLEGYEIGAEEYIPKPFHLKELLLRIRHVLTTHAVTAPALKVGERTIDFGAHAIVGPNGEKEFLAARDLDLLKLLIETAPNVLSRDEILDKVWGEDKYPSHRTVDNAIVRLRSALGENEVIRSVRGVGYQWVGTRA